MKAYCKLQISLSNDDFTTVLYRLRHPEPFYLLNLSVSLSFLHQMIQLSGDNIRESKLDYIISTLPFQMAFFKGYMTGLPSTAEAGMRCITFN